jgi:hypothetical protein
MLNGRASRSSFFGGAVCGVLAVVAASHSARVAAAPGDRLSRFPFEAAAHDIVYAGGGNDTIYGWGGLDVLCGVDGHDVVYGGSGNDQLVGGRGDDVLDGGTGNGDYCNGESQTNADTAVGCEVTRNIP